MIRILLLSLVLLGTSVEAQKKIGKEDVVLIKSGKSTEPMRVLQVTNPKDLKILNLPIALHSGQVIQQRDQEPKEF